FRRVFDNDRFGSAACAFSADSSADYDGIVAFVEGKFVSFVQRDSRRPVLHQRLNFTLQRSDYGNSWQVSNSLPVGSNTSMFMRNHSPETSLPRGATRHRRVALSIRVHAPLWYRKRTSSCVPCELRQWSRGARVREYAR